MTEIHLTAADGHDFGAYRADPEGPPRGGVIVIQEIFGVNDHIRSVTDRAAAAGFIAVAPYLFDRVEPGIELAYDGPGVERGRDVAWTLPIEDTIADLQATADRLGEAIDDPGGVGAIGFCYGGMLAAALASRAARHLAASVAYYPSMAAQLLVDDKPQVPLMVHLGDTDARVTPDDGRTLAERWPDATFHRYPAGHGFNCDLRADYDQPSAAQAWERTISFLTANLRTET